MGTINEKLKAVGISEETYESHKALYDEIIKLPTGKEFLLAMRQLGKDHIEAKYLLTQKLLFEKLNAYAGKYQFSFQLWGKGEYTIYISKDFVELTSFGGYEDAEDCMLAALNYLDRINKKL